MNRRVAFVGHLGSGKTTAADYLVRNHGFKRYSFAAKLKAICKEMYPEQFSEGAPKPREMLQFIGTDAFRRFDENVWVKYLVRQIQSERPSCAVIDDCRFPNEAETLRNIGFLIIKIERSQRVAEGSGTSAEAHPSETLIDSIRPDLIFENNGSLDDLGRWIEGMLSSSELKPRNFYLAHSFGHAVEVRDWELQFEARTGIQLFNPFNEGKEKELYIPYLKGELPFIDYLQTPDWSTFVADDIENLESHDALLALIFPNTLQIGTPQEIAEAFYMKKPIYVITHDMNPFIQNHWWLKRVNAKIFQTRDEFERYITT